MLTFAQLKRDAKSGGLYGELIEWYGSTDIPEELMGPRKIVGSNSTGIFFALGEYRKKPCVVGRACLVEYEINELRIYAPGTRSLTPGEHLHLHAWDYICLGPESKEILRCSLLESSSYYRTDKKEFFFDMGYPYLMAYNECKEGKYDPETNKVWDTSIKGELALRYRITRKG